MIFQYKNTDGDMGKKMEIKNWSYEDYPEFKEIPDGAKSLKTSGDEIGVSYINDIVYDEVDGVELYLQILIPSSRNVQRPFIEEKSLFTNESEKLLPCVCFVQGSAWMKQNIYASLPSLSKLSAKGYVVATIEYRHSGIAPFPAQIVDARNAVRFLRKNAPRFYIDQTRMIVAGDSSGGHTALFAGIRHNDGNPENHFPGVSGDVRGIIDLYGSVTAMLDDGFPSTINHHTEASPEGMLMGGVNLKEHPDLTKEMSAECNISFDTEIPPVLIFHGTKDRTINPQQSVVLYEQLKRCGKDASLYLIEGADHGGAEFWSDETIGIMDAFIKRCLD